MTPSIWSSVAASRVGGRPAIAQRTRSRASKSGDATHPAATLTSSCSLWGVPLHVASADDSVDAFLLAIVCLAALLLMLWLCEYIEQTAARMEAGELESEADDEELERDETETRR
jgi:hypothetical protein